MVLEQAARLALKNRIVVDVLTGPESGPAPTTVEDWSVRMGEQLERLAGESAAIAARLVRERDRAAATDGLGRHHHDYRHLDANNLTRRIAVCARVAHVLRDRAGDPVAVRRLLAEARTMADDELARAVRTAVEDAGSPVRPEDAAVLAERLHQLATIDLPALVRSPPVRSGPLGALRGRVRALSRRGADH